MLIIAAGKGQLALVTSEYSLLNSTLIPPCHKIVRKSLKQYLLTELIFEKNLYFKPYFETAIKRLKYRGKLDKIINKYIKGMCNIDKNINNNYLNIRKSSPSYFGHFNIFNFFTN